MILVVIMEAVIIIVVAEGMAYLHRLGGSLETETKRKRERINEIK